MRQAHANREMRIISSLPTESRALVALGKMLAEIARALDEEAERQRVRKLVSELMLFALADRILARSAHRSGYIAETSTTRRSIRAFLSHPPAGWAAP